MPKINDLEVDDYLYRCVTLDRVHLMEEFTRVSSDMAYWSRNYALAHREYLRSKLLLTRARALAYAEARALLVAQYGKATQKDIDASVASHDRVQEAEAAMVEAEFNRECLKGNVEAVRSKRDMLITVGAHIRAEMSGSPRINTQHHKPPEDDDWGADGD